MGSSWFLEYLKEMHCKSWDFSPWVTAAQGERFLDSDTNPNLVPFLPSCCRADDGSQPNPYFGQKYLGVSKGGTLEIHGKKKLSWTFLNKTLHPGGMEEGGYYFERSWGHRGVIVHVIDPKTGAVVHSDRWVILWLPRCEDLWEEVGDSISASSNTHILASCSNGCYCMSVQFLPGQQSPKPQSEQCYALQFVNYSLINLVLQNPLTHPARQVLLQQGNITVDNTKEYFLYSTCFSVQKDMVMTAVNVYMCFLSFQVWYLQSKRGKYPPGSVFG